MSHCFNQFLSVVQTLKATTSSRAHSLGVPTTSCIRRVRAVGYSDGILTWCILPLIFEVNLCLLPPTESRVSELLCHSRSFRSPELDEHWATSIEHGKLSHSGVELELQVVESRNLVESACSELVEKPFGSRLDDDLAERLFGWRSVLLCTGESVGAQLLERGDGCVHVDAAAVGLDIVQQEGLVVGRGRVEEDRASCWKLALASDVDYDRRLVARTLVTAVGEFADRHGSVVNGRVGSWLSSWSMLRVIGGM
jgi:hypothetical protein